MLNARKSLMKAPLAAAIITALGLSATAPAVQAVGLTDGNYTIYINTTPTAATTSGTAYKFGKNGAWNSSFTFGGPAPSASSQAMTDETSGRHTVTGSDGIARGSGVVGDGWTGRIGISVSSNAITFTSFSKDLILNTAGGDFVQLFSDAATGPDASASVTGAGGSGTITSSTGAINMTLLGRLGSIGAPNNLYNRTWNNDDVCGHGWTVFTTGSTSTYNNDCTTNVTITGAPLSCASDINGDGVNDCTAILVSGGTIGSTWASFQGAKYFEVWNVVIKSAVTQTGSIVTATNTAATLSVPPSGTTGITPFTVTGKTNGTNGTVTNTSSSVTYTPNASYTGSDSFTYTFTDGNGQSKTGTVNVTVQATPVANNDTASTHQNTAVAIDVLSNDAAGLTTASVTVLSGPSNGSTSVNSSTGVITYTPTAGFVGSDSFTYRAANSTPTNTNTATVNVTVGTWGLTSSGTYALGTLATAKSSSDGTVTSTDVQTDSTVANQCIGGCFDFTVTGITALSTINVVLPPLSATLTTQNITDGIRYRKFISNAWKAFDTSTGDAVASQPLAAGGGCPTPGAAGWTTWTSAVASSSNVGDRCIRLTITDNGPNDGNSTSGTIADPSGAGSGTPVSTAVTTPDALNSFGSSSQGCSISPVAVAATEGGAWWLVAGFLVWLRALSWKRARNNNKA